MTGIQELEAICRAKAAEKQLSGEAFEGRLLLEMKEINAQNETDVFVDLYTRRVRYAENENNLLTPYLLGIVPTVDLNKEAEFVWGDMPDVDVDYIPAVQQYLKNDWAPRTFGVENVCNIGTYSTFGIKSALIDMAKVHDKDRDEILALTTKLKLKDEDGEVLTWANALEEYPALKDYCDKNPEVAEAARRMLNRSKSMGVHAGGLIVSREAIANFVPLVKSKEGTQVSAWVEGLRVQQLGPMGLIKFDILVVLNLLQIANGSKLLFKRHGIEKVSALPGNVAWSDTAYLNDPKALAMANDGNLKCVFQFDSEGIRTLVKSGGVTSFEDLVAYSALYRPGPLDCLREGTRISISTGTKAIDKLEPGIDKVEYLDQDGELKYTNRYFVSRTGTKKILKIITRSGKELYSSPDHRVMAENGVYVQAGNLIVGDKLVTKN